jgi:hypothetical protein
MSLLGVCFERQARGWSCSKPSSCLISASGGDHVTEEREPTVAHNGTGGSSAPEAIPLKSASKRRQSWDFDPPPPAPPRRNARDKDDPRPRAARSFGIALITLLLIAGAAIYLVRFRGFNLQRLRSAIPLKAEVPAQPAPAPAPTPAPTPAQVPRTPQQTTAPVIHNSPDTTCDGRRQCSNAEFAELSDSLQRQWALTPEEIRSKCATQSTYPAAEHCILSNSISFMAQHADATAPWINPKNFDSAIMALCQKNPKSLALCSKP